MEGESELLVCLSNSDRSFRQSVLSMADAHFGGSDVQCPGCAGTNGLRAAASSRTGRPLASLGLHL